MHCPHCHLEHADNAQFCPTTGLPIQVKTNICPDCGRELQDGLRFCPSCGRKLDASVSKAKISNWAILAIVVLLIGSISGYMIWGYLQPRFNKSTSFTSSSTPITTERVEVVQVPAQKPTATIDLSKPKQSTPTTQFIPATPAPSFPLPEGDMGILISEHNTPLKFYHYHEGRILWEQITFEGRLCGSVLPNEHFFLCKNKEINEIDRYGSKVQARTVPTGYGLYIPIDENLVLVQVVDSDLVRLLDREENEIWSLDGIHSLSDVQLLSNGNVLIADGTQILREVDSNGVIVWTARTSSWACNIHRLPDGQTLVGEAGRVELLDNDGQVVWERTGYRRACTVDQLPDNNILISDLDLGIVEVLSFSGESIWKITGLRLPVSAYLPLDSSTQIAEKPTQTSLDPDTGDIQPLNGNNLIQMTRSKIPDYTPSLASDQSTLAFASKIGGFWQVFINDPDGIREPQQITSGDNNYYHPAFNSDGRQLLVSSDLNGNLDLYLLNASTGEILEQLTSNPADDYAPEWLPDQSGYLFTSNRDGNDEIYLGKLDGSDPIRLTDDPGFDGYPSPSRDGKRVAFYANRDGNYEIYLMKLDNLKPRRLTNHPARDADPVFSPDGGWIVFESERGGNYEIYALRIDDGELINLTEDPSNDYVPSFSPDGQWLLFQSDRSGNMDIYRIPWHTGHEDQSSSTETDQEITITVNEKDSAELVFVPAGEFHMGSDSETDPYFYGAEGPSHNVYLDEYWIYRTEVTNAMYQACVADQACPKPVQLGSNTREEYYGNAQYDDYPVVYVSWKYAVAYCRWAGGRLPTEAEWEKAARGTDGRLFPWGNQPPGPNMANYGTQDTVAVGSFPEGASPYGIYDMAGNVIEWVFDYFQSTYYSASPDENPLGPASGTSRVYRSGSYHNLDPAIRVVMRGSRDESHTNVDIGFRCAVDQP